MKFWITPWSSTDVMSNFKLLVFSLSVFITTLESYDATSCYFDTPIRSCSDDISKFGSFHLYRTAYPKILYSLSSQFSVEFAQPCGPHESRVLKNTGQNLQKPFETSSKAGGHPLQCAVIFPPCFKIVSSAVLNHRKRFIADTLVLSFMKITPLQVLPWRSEHYREFQFKVTWVQFCSKKNPQLSFHLQSEASRSGGLYPPPVANLLIFILSLRCPLNVQ